MPEPVVGLSPKILEEVQKELEKLKREKKPPNAEQAVVQALESDMNKLSRIVYAIRAEEKADLKEVLAEFKRFNEQIQRRVWVR